MAEAPSTAIHDENFWADLLDSMEAGRVIPIIGEGATTFGPDDAKLMPWLARRLAESLQLSPEIIAKGPTLNEVVCMWLLKGERRNTVYTRLNRILKDECPEPGPTLRDLAGISAFNLYLTTSFDPLLERALNAVRFGDQPRAQGLSFVDKEDLPFRRRELAGATVYHLFGKASALPNFAVWEEDTLDFMCDLHRLLNVSNMKNLACDLKEHSLLVLGLNFSDWLVRFFMRIARQEKLSSSSNIDYLADGPEETLPRSMVLFFGGATKNVQVIPCDPRKFSAELARRWQDRQRAAGAQSPAPVATPAASLPSAEMPRGAIFVSYAREDEEALKRLKAGLERHGCLVWYDRERLKPGVNWHNELENEVKDRCALFLSVVSRTTETSVESYYHLERNWAEYRAEFFSSGEEFYISVVIDDSPMPFQKEPRRFRKVQATRLLNGEVTAEFGEHLRQLQARRRIALASS